MSKLTALLFALFFFTTITQAQTILVSGAVEDTIQHKGVQNAVVALPTPIDSVLYKFTRTDAKGNYVFKNLKAGNYILMTTHPYFADYVDNISASGNTRSAAILRGGDSVAAATGNIQTLNKNALTRFAKS